MFVCLFTLTYFWLFHVLSQQRHLQIHPVGLVWLLSLTANQRDEICKIVWNSLKRKSVTSFTANVYPGCETWFADLDSLIVTKRWRKISRSFAFFFVPDCMSQEVSIYSVNSFHAQIYRTVRDHRRVMTSESSGQSWLAQVHETMMKIPMWQKYRVFSLTWPAAM